MNTLKEGIIVKPFGSKSKLSGKIDEDVTKWLIDKGLIKETDLVDTGKEKTPKRPMKRVVKK